MQEGDTCEADTGAGTEKKNPSLCNYIEIRFVFAEYFKHGFEL